MLDFATTFASDKNALTVHNIRLANPLDPHAKALKRANAKRGKTDEDYAEVMRIEWEGGLYYDRELGAYLPSSYPMRSMLEAARMTKDGKNLERAVTVMAEDGSNRIPIQYDGPRQLDAMWDARDENGDPTYCDVRMVRVGQSKVLRSRPRFPVWNLEFVIVLDETVMNPDVLQEIVVRAGRNIGIGESPEGSRARFDATAREIDGGEDELKRAA